jgi:hypothetical protein
MFVGVAFRPPVVDEDRSSVDIAYLREGKGEDGRYGHEKGCGAERNAQPPTPI